MKLTRMFILKAFDEDNKNYDNEDPINSLKKLIITNSNVDIAISFVLSLLYMISIGFISSKFNQDYSINFIIFVKLTIVLSVIFILLEFFRITIITWEKYLRSLNKPQNYSEKSSLQSNKSKNSSNSKNSENKNGEFNFKKRIEMEEFDDKKNPFLSKEEKNADELFAKKSSNNKDIFGSSKNYIFNEGNKFNIINNKKDYIEVYYESILSSPNNNFYDKIFIKIYIYLIKKLNKLINEENYLDINNKQKKFSLYKIIIKYPHTISTIFHLLKNILFLLSFGLSFSFWILYSSLKLELKDYSFNIINIFLGECFELYALFRLCFFFIKIIVNFSLSPLYISAICSRYYEDQFNLKLNDLIKTRFYTGKKCLISRDSLNKIKENEIDDTCAVCINKYINGDVISTLPCSKRHSFHTYCLEEWFHTSVSCPMCRCDFSNEIGIFLPNNEQNDNANNVNIGNDQNILYQQNLPFIIPNDIFNLNQGNNEINNNNNNNENANNNINNENVNNNNILIHEENNNRQNIEMREINNNENNNINNVNNGINNN